MPIYFTREKLTELEIDVIVSPVEQAAGGHPVEVSIEKAENLPASFIIHTAVPIWQDGSEAELKLLQQSYSSSLQLAKESGCESIALPLFTSGASAFAEEEALKTAQEAIRIFLEENEMTVILTLQNRQPSLISKKLSTEIEAYLENTYSTKTSFVRKTRKADLREELLDLAEMSMFRTPAPKRSLEDLVNNLDETFSEMLLRLIDEKGFSDVETYKKANIDRKLFSKIRSNRDYHPSKPTALALAIALELNLDETTDLLKKAGLALSYSSKFDVIIEYFIVNQNHDIFEINEALFSFDQVLLGG